MVKDHSGSEKGNPLPPHNYSFRLTARVLLYAPSHRQDSTYHSLCYTSRGALAGTRNSSMGPPHEGSIRRSYHGATSRSYKQSEMSGKVNGAVLEWVHHEGSIRRPIAPWAVHWPESEEGGHCALTGERGGRALCTDRRARREGTVHWPESEGTVHWPESEDAVHWPESEQGGHHALTGERGGRARCTDRRARREGTLDWPESEEGGH